MMHPDAAERIEDHFEEGDEAISAHFVLDSDEDDSKTNSGDNVDGEQREGALKAELRKERDERLKVDREERERERAQRQSEKAEADKKYELLKTHLLEVEETTMDIVAWTATNDTKVLDRIKLRAQRSTGHAGHCR